MHREIFPQLTPAAFCIRRNGAVIYKGIKASDNLTRRGRKIKKPRNFCFESNYAPPLFHCEPPRQRLSTAGTRRIREGKSSRFIFRLDFFVIYEAEYFTALTSVKYNLTAKI